MRGLCGLCAYARQSLVAPHFVWLRALMSCAQGRGLGSRLVRELENWALAHGYSKMMLSTLANNVGARRLYVACGFDLAKEVPWNPADVPSLRAQVRSSVQTCGCVRVCLCVCCVSVRVCVCRGCTRSSLHGGVCWSHEQGATELLSIVYYEKELHA
jgi:hypothetical protein